MKKKLACITLDLESDHSGFVKERCYSLWSSINFQKILNLLKTTKIPLSVFIVGDSIGHNLKSIDLISSAKSEFHLHSNTHNFSDPDSLTEIREGVDNFKKHFGYHPRGYRAPKGLISQKGLTNLKKNNFNFDSSIIPSFWPNPNYLKYPSAPFFHKLNNREKILELPISTTKPLRLPFSLSFIKLFGINIYKNYIYQRKIYPIVFNFHLHDIFISKVHKKMSPIYQALYTKNQFQGFDLFTNFLLLLKKNDYEFILISQLASAYEK